MGFSSVLLLSTFVSLLDSFFIGLRLTFSTFSTMISFFGEILSSELHLDDERDSYSFFPDLPESCNIKGIGPDSIRFETLMLVSEIESLDDRAKSEFSKFS